MELSALSRESPSSRYANQLSEGYSNLKFSTSLENEFRAFYVSQNLLRGRLSGLIGLILVLSFTGADLLFGGDGVGYTINIIRLGVLSPLLIMIVVATYLKFFERLYSELAAVGVAIAGLLVTIMCLAAAAEGAFYAVSAIVLVNLFACLFLGLFFYQAVVVSSLLVFFYAVLAYSFGMPGNELLFTVAVLASAALMGTIATYNLEYSLRTNFLETRLLNDLAERDGLTGLYNRRIFDDYVLRVWRQSRRESTSIEIIFIDIDYFKIYNDLYGHQHGDDCLRRVAQTIARCAKRPLDFCARYGGEEFVLVLFGPPSDYGRSVPEQIRREIADLAIPHEGSSVANCVTVSVGVALASPESGRSLAGAIQVADEALYEAKRLGRNRIVFKNANKCDIETGNFRVNFRGEPA